MYRFSRRTFGGLLLGVAAAPVAAQTTSWPDKPVKLVVGFTAGSATDVTARIFAQRFGEAWGQRRGNHRDPGAGGEQGVDLALRDLTPADDHTALPAQAQEDRIIGHWRSLPHVPPYWSAGARLGWLTGQR